MRTLTFARHGVQPLATICLSIATLAAIASLACAQAAEDDRCRALYDEGRNAFDQKDRDYACKLFAQAFECNEQSPDAEYMLAWCDRRSGKYADAWTHYTAAATKYGAPGDPGRSAERADSQRRCQEAADQVRPLRARLRFDLQPPADSLQGLSVLLDGKQLPETAVVAGFPINPGSHHIEITAEGYQPFTAELDAKTGSEPLIVVPLVRRVFLAVGPQPPGPATLGVDGTDPPPRPPVVALHRRVAAASPSDRGQMQRIMGWTLAGVGAAATIAATVFWVLTANDVDESNPYCEFEDGSCDSKGVELRNNARDKQTIAIVLTAAGGAAIIGGLTVVFTAPSGGNQAPSAQLLWRGTL